MCSLRSGNFVVVAVDFELLGIATRIDSRFEYEDSDVFSIRSSAEKLMFLFFHKHHELLCFCKLLKAVIWSSISNHLSSSYRNHKQIEAGD